jgi:hypothetical protein
MVLVDHWYSAETQTNRQWFMLKYIQEPLAGSDLRNEKTANRLAGSAGAKE